MSLVHKLEAEPYIPPAKVQVEQKQTNINFYLAFKSVGITSKHIFNELELELIRKKAKESTLEPETAFFQASVEILNFRRKFADEKKSLIIDILGGIELNQWN